MRFIVDAQLPRSIARSIIAMGDEAVHTLDLPRGNLTTDSEIIRLALRDESIVVTKDQDFVDSFLLRGEPSRLLHITTGNISNAQLIRLIEAHWQQVRSMFTQGSYVELNLSALMLHM